eukprot:TRINITY_DN31075_c1_g1_i1.p1 TRINITY_DN31075_c1_g1~~TRINITY_DN31075_c1_g1_i1.p1  ORF type:complete len:300 (-),score=63.71 TRINITY_DN31075_c1_g1_i1:493-1344(-)
MSLNPSSAFFGSLMAGGFAGTAVDLTLFPLDTLKTRLQSSMGFLKAGGFSRIYSGVLSAAVGSAPAAGIFFATYDTCKRGLHRIAPVGVSDPQIHMAAAAIGETAACLVRVPTENVKQKLQARICPSTSSTLAYIIKTDGITGFYRGYLTTVLREIPFAFIQYPLWEGLKSFYSTQVNRPLQPLEAGLCGALAGATAGGITTPLDTIKTRIMLGKDAHGVAYKGFLDTAVRISAEATNLKTFFAGALPRMLTIALGGFIFFGAYSFALESINKRDSSKSNKWK